MYGYQLTTRVLISCPSGFAFCAGVRGSLGVCLSLGGFLITLIGLAANIYFQHRRDKREAAESLARIAALRE